MKFKFVWVGKTRDRNWKALQEEYLQRLSHFVKCEIVEIKDSTAREGQEIEGNGIARPVESNVVRRPAGCRRTPPLVSPSLLPSWKIGRTFAT